jgi:hypothetical protein
VSEFAAKTPNFSGKNLIKVQSIEEYRQPGLLCTPQNFAKGSKL